MEDLYAIEEDALALIRQLQAENAEKDARIQQLEREQPIWHILPYDLPPYTGSYIVCTASGKVCTAKWYEQRNDFAGIGRKHIVAWQWLPLGITVEGDNDEIC